jgi:protein FRG1
VGNVLVETSSGGYLSALDDGTVTTALPRPADNDPDNMPEPQDIITMVKVSDTRVAFKTAYGRYLTAVPDTGEVTARTEAMGVRCVATF